MFQSIKTGISRWLTMAVQRMAGQPLMEEVIVTQVMKGRLRFAQYVDPKEGETPAMRNSYRSLTKEPTVKSCLDTIIGGVASGEIDVPPVTKGLRDQIVADYCRDLIRFCEGGMIGITTATIGNGCIEGYSVCERKWHVPDSGRWAGKIMLQSLKPKPTDDYWFEVDQFWNVTGIKCRLTQDLYPKEDMVYWRHQNYTQSPYGTSLLRSCYRSAWMLDTVWKLRGIGLERYTLPVLIGKYPLGDNATKASMESAIKRLKATGFGLVPNEASIDAVNMAIRGTTDFEAAVKDLKEEICIGMLGGSLQTLQGFTPGGRGSSAVHMSVVDTRIWMYANALVELIHRQIFTPAVHATFGPDTQVPWPVLGGLNDEEVKKSLDLDEQMQRMGYPVSISGISERTRRSPGSGDDALKPPGQGQQGGPGGGLAGLLGGFGGGSGTNSPSGDNGPPKPPNEPPQPPEPTPPPIPQAPALPYSERPQVVVINTGGASTGYRSFAASDWQQNTGPRGGVYWQNIHSGERVYQHENPGGSGDGQRPAEGGAPQTQQREPWQDTTQPGPTTPSEGTTARTPRETPPPPAGWGERQLIPGRSVRPDAEGRPTWNQATATGIRRAQPILDEVQRLFQNPMNITDADVQRVIDSIANISGRDALYTVAVALGVPGSMQPGVVAGNVSRALNPHRPYTPSSSSTPLTPAERTRQPRAGRATPAATTATPALPESTTPPAPAAPPAPAEPEKKLKFITKVKKDLAPSDERSIDQTMKSLLPDWDALKGEAGHTSTAVLSLIGMPDWVRPQDINLSARNGQISVSVVTKLPDTNVTLTLQRTIGKDRNGSPFIHNDLFTRSDTRSEGGFNGYYTWARFGYDYPISSLDGTTAARARTKFPGARTVQDIMKTPEGRDWWFSYGSGMGDAKFDLTPGSRSMEVLTKYGIAKRAKKAFPTAKTLEDIKNAPGGKEWLQANLHTAITDDDLAPSVREQRQASGGPAIPHPGVGAAIFANAVKAASSAGIKYFETYAAGSGNGPAEERRREREQQSAASAAAARNPNWPSKGTTPPHQVTSREIRSMTTAQRSRWDDAVRNQARRGNMVVSPGQTFNGSDTGNPYRVERVDVHPTTRDITVTLQQTNSRAQRTVDAPTLVWMGWRPPGVQQ